MKLRLLAAAAFTCVACHPTVHTLDDFSVSATRPTRSERYTLYKMLQPIGIEVDTATPTPDGGQEAKANFVFDDRDTFVTLAATFRLDRAGAVTRYDAWGDVARGTALDDHVRARGDGSFDVRRVDTTTHAVTPSGPFAVASGYAPMLGEELLLQHWLHGGRPAQLSLLPAGEARFESRGREPYTLGDQRVLLEHVVINGLTWGRHDVWIDDRGQLAAVVTRDAEFDHFEAMRSAYVPLVEQLVARAGSDAVAWLAQAARPLPSSGAVALVGGRLIDGRGGVPVEDSIVVYDGDQIVAAGPRASTQVPAGALVVDVSGKSVLPGLWDMHAHVEQVEQAAVYLAAGITTVRDEGNILPFLTSLRDTIEAGRGLGPRILVDGLVDGGGASAIGTLRVERASDIAPVIDTLVAHHCLELKIYSSVAPELVPALVAEAHRRGLRVTGHVPDGMSMEQAVDDGYDGINHAQFMFSTFMSNDHKELRKLGDAEIDRRLAAARVDDPALQRLFAKMVKRHVILDPTLAVMETFWLPLPELRKVEPGLSRLPRELQANFTGAPPDRAPHTKLRMQKLIELVGAAHRAGVTLVAGTDQAVLGFSLARELELYVQAGLTPLEALATATSVPAHVLGRDDLGTIAVGKHADLIVVDGNPAQHVGDVRRVTRVVARGRAYDPAPLWTLVGYKP